MQNKIVEIEELNEEDKAKYYDFVKSSVKDGEYFKDGLEWYFLKYVNPFSQRTILIFSAIISMVVLFYLYGMIKLIYPLVEKVPIFISARDQSAYFPNLVSLNLKEDPEVLNVDEAVAKYLISVYVKDREGYDYSKADIADINKKLNRLKNSSSNAQYREFQLFMSKDNLDSPIYKYGKDIRKEIEVSSVEFVRDKNKDIASKASDFLKIKLPTEARVSFKATTYSTKDEVTKKESEDFIVDISFTFKGAENTKNKVPLNFAVNNYQLYKVKK